MKDYNNATETNKIRDYLHYLVIRHRGYTYGILNTSTREYYYLDALLTDIRNYFREHYIWKEYVEGKKSIKGLVPILGVDIRSVCRYLLNQRLQFIKFVEQAEEKYEKKYNLDFDKGVFVEVM